MPQLSDVLLIAPFVQPFTLKVAVASGLEYATPLLDAVRNGTNTYNFLEASWGCQSWQALLHRQQCLQLEVRS